IVKTLRVQKTRHLNNEIMRWSCQRSLICNEYRPLPRKDIIHDLYNSWSCMKVVNKCTLLRMIIVNKSIIDNIKFLYWISSVCIYLSCICQQGLIIIGRCLLNNITNNIGEPTLREVNFEARTTNGTLCCEAIVEDIVMPCSAFD